MSWLESHAINPKLARYCGVAGTMGGVISFRYGHAYHRHRLPDGSMRGPKGQPLGLYWPTGQTQAHTVLLCEGEGDTLAAASVLCDEEANPRTFDDAGLDNILGGIVPVGVPGSGTPTRVICGELLAAGTKMAYVCMDGDEAGQKASERYCEGLEQLVGICALSLDMPEGLDLSDFFRSLPDGAKALADLIAYAEDPVPA